ncbi:hypothetical protein AXF42_Ash010517 [Apostasia shenzhenica]|uniref:Uncharacterized protein n=1 Tax=Apostasia shenzhenica TaxID=1088818 RepID=A0A2I0A6A5_9ASPA|nr:hypothetical protein AXF42_Ash010517 [Apostasia shenzhenica]
MGYLMENIQKGSFIPAKPMKDDLPICHEAAKEAPLIGLRRRISSFSSKIHPLSSSAASSWAALRRTKSAPSLIGEFADNPLRRWWEWSWGWLLSKKPAIARDLEMNEEEEAILGCQSRGSLRHVFFKIRAQIRKIVRSQTLPTTQKFRYDSSGYAQNYWDEGKQSRGEI